MMGIVDRLQSILKPNTNKDQTPATKKDESSFISSHRRTATSNHYFFEDYITITPKTKNTLQEFQQNTSATHVTLLLLGCTTSFILGFKIGRTPNPFRRFTSVTSIPNTYFDSTNNAKTILRGRVISVSDGDTIRFLHVPTIFHTSHLHQNNNNKKKRIIISDVTIPIRICTIDTPEVSKFGKEGQPFGQDAKSLLESNIGNKIVNVRLLSKDQYGRAVAEVFWRPFFVLPSVFADEVMLKAGLAEVYRGSGAVYGRRGLDYYVGLEREARERKIGMWGQDERKRESAAEFKARLKAEKE